MAELMALGKTTSLGLALAGSLGLALWSAMARPALANDGPQAALQSPAAQPASTRTIGNLRIVVEDVPAATDNLYRVSAEQTPSGFAVPRFVSLKFGKVNARTGPSRDHPIAYQYQRRGLPLVVVAETEMWRKVRDIQGDEAWVRKPALSGERFAIAMSDVTLRHKPDPDTRAIARIERGALLSLDGCDMDGFCRVEAPNGLKGWISRRQLWGAQSLD